MRINKNQVMEINLKDLFFYLLYRWRSILAAALIGAIALCGYQYLSIKKAHDAGELTKDERQYQINVQQYKEELASNRNMVTVYTKLLREQNDYLDNSIYIKLSPNNVYIARNSYLIKADQSVLDALPQGSSMDPVDSILPAYAAPLAEITDEEELKEAFGTDKTEYVSELVLTSTNTDENTITVYVFGDTKETAQKGLALLHKQMEAIAAGKAQELGKHQLILANESVIRGIDKLMSELPEGQGNLNLSTRQADLSKATKEIQETLQKARQRIDQLEASGEPGVPGMHLGKMAVIGFIVGAVILMLVYIIVCIVSGRLYNSRDLTTRYSIPVLGEFATPGCLHPCRGIDKLFARWELGKDALDDKTVYDKIAALIAEKQEAKHVLLVSTLSAEEVKNVREVLAERLPEKKIEAQADAVRNSGAITEAAKADVIVFTEKKGKSRFKNMDRVAETLIITDGNVIGAIIL